MLFYLLYQIIMSLAIKNFKKKKKLLDNIILIWYNSQDKKIKQSISALTDSASAHR